MRTSRFLAALLAIVMILGFVAACGGDDDSDDSASTESTATTAPATSDEISSPTTESSPTTASSPSASDSTANPAISWSGDGAFPVTIENAFGSTTIEAKPERVATVQWSNEEVPLALGIVPVGMAAANFGDDNGDGVLPWTEEKLKELGAETPVLFDETDGIDFEAVANTKPDVILAPYSGLSSDDYEQLSKIAPVVAYPEVAWGTPWRVSIELSSAALGLHEEGMALIADREQTIAEAVAKHPEIQGVSTMFLTHVDEADLSTLNFYTPNDTRVMFFSDLGLGTPASIAELSKTNDKFSGSISAENADTFADVELIVTYGGADLVKTLEGDALLSQIPAVKNGAIVSLPGNEPMGTASNPTALQIPYLIDGYVELIANAVASTE